MNTSTPSCCTFAPSAYSYGATECGWWELGCKKAEERLAQHDSIIEAAKAGQFTIPEDTGPGIAPYVAIAALLLGGTAAVIFM